MQNVIIFYKFNPIYKNVLPFNHYFLNTLLGDHLEEKYNAATRVKTTRRGRLKVKRKDSKIPTANELVFLKRSPDYCHQNGTIGSLGKTCQLNNILKVFSQIKYTL